MSNIVLSASVRQNLLSLQSTADLLATTQSRLATGKKVNTALDNPTNYFTAASLDSRASDINNLLDGIGNGVQVLQAANTGISSLQKLIDSAKSVANQALQSAVSYSPKSSVTSAAITGATAQNLLGTGIGSAGTVAAGAFTAVNVSGAGAPAAAGTFNAGAFTAVDVSGAATAAADITGAGFTALDVSSGSVVFNLSVDGAPQAITINAANVAAYNTAATATLNAAALTAQDVADVINYQFNGNTIGTTAPVTVTGGQLEISSATTGATSNVTVSGYTSTANGGTIGLANGNNSGTAADLLSFTVTVDGGAPSTITLTAANVTAYNTANATALTANNLSAQDVADIVNYQIPGAATIATVTGGNLTFTSPTTGPTSTIATSAVTSAGTPTGSTGVVSNTDSGTALVAPDSLSFTVTVDGGAPSTVTLSAATVAAYNTANAATLNATTLSAQDVADIANYQIPGAATIATVVTGALVFTSSTIGSTSSVATSAVTGTATAGSTGVISANNTGANGVGPLATQTLTIPATSQGAATNITFGTGLGQVATLNQLNAALAPNSLLASIDTTGRITITTSNDFASETIGAIGGTAAGVGSAFNGLTASAPVADPTVQMSRAGLVLQYNKIIEQIVTTSQDASFNGVNLLAGDTLKLVFNETGKSVLNIQGVNFTPPGLGLGSLATGTDFIDNNRTNLVLTSLNNAGNSLRSQAAALGSNLSIVQIRQEFSKNLINVLQTGSANLTLADTNEEAANSQALSTRQSIAVSALALANQSQQSVLQLLRT